MWTFVIMASNLPMYGPKVVADVIAKAHDCLLPGGEMHLIGETVDDDKTGPVGPAFWGSGPGGGRDHWRGSFHDGMSGLLPRGRLY